MRRLPNEIGVVEDALAGDQNGNTGDVDHQL